MYPMTHGTTGHGNEFIPCAPLFKHISQGQEKPLLFSLQIYLLFEQQVVFRGKM
jgi:hypothetical protein